MTNTNRTYPQLLIAITLMVALSMPMISFAPTAEADGEESIHDLKRAKEKGLEKEIVYDWYKRKSFIDHLFLPDVTLESLKKNTFWDKGNFVTGEYDFSINKKRNNVSVDLEKKGIIYGDDRERDFYLKKIFTINKESVNYTF